MKIVIAALAAAAVLAVPAQATIPNARIPVSKTVQTKALKQIGQVLRQESKAGERRGSLYAPNGCYTEGSNR